MPIKEKKNKESKSSQNRSGPVHSTTLEGKKEGGKKKQRPKLLNRLFFAVRGPRPLPHSTKPTARKRSVYAYKYVHTIYIRELSVLFPLSLTWSSPSVSLSGFPFRGNSTEINREDSISDKQSTVSLLAKQASKQSLLLSVLL